jgi:uncharacterized protein (DUF2164 family)
MSVELAPEVKREALTSLRRYCADELELDLSEVQTAGLLGFMLKEIGPSLFNAGLARAEAYLRDRLADLEGSCAEIEFSYWPKRSVRRK